MSVTQAPSRISHGSTQQGCPKCHSQTPWGENSWCPDCGYYPMVDANAPTGTSWADSLPEVQTEEIDNRTALQAIPGWFWLMVAGMVTITLTSIGVRYGFADQEGTRGLIALTQVTICVVTMLVAHLLAARFAMRGDRRLKLQDVLLSWFNIWQPTIGTLPAGCKRLLCMVWGIIGFITAVAVIGGIDYSAPFRTDRQAAIQAKDVVGAVAGAAKSQAENQPKPQSMEDALDELQQSVDDLGETSGMAMDDALDELTKTSTKLLKDLDNPTPEELEKLLQDHNAVPTLNCFAYGVITDRRKVPVAFLFAANTQGEDQHVAEIRAQDMDRDLYRRIVMRLYQAIQSEPEIQTQRDAIWVKPIVVCRLKFRKLSPTGELQDAEVEALLVQQPTQQDSTAQRSGTSHRR